MLKVKDKYDYRREFCDALRSGKYKQIRGRYAAGRTMFSGRPRVCAIGLYALVFDTYLSSFYDHMGFNAWEIVRRNDCGHSFEEIADWIESQL